VLKIYCALSAECTPERVHSTEVPSAALASCVALELTKWCSVVVDLF